MKKHTILVILASYIASMTYLATSYAIEGRKYPGSMCHAYFANQTSQIQYLDGAKLYNNSYSYLWVVCPVIIDHSGTVSGEQYALVHVKHSGRVTADFTCIFKNIDDYNGNTLYSNSGRVSSYWAGQSELMRINIPRSYYAISTIMCRVPPFSEIRNYIIGNN